LLQGTEYIFANADGTEERGFSRLVPEENVCGLFWLCVFVFVSLGAYFGGFVFLLACAQTAFLVKLESNHFLYNLVFFVNCGGAPLLQ
jgi:hypothetical protein